MKIGDLLRWYSIFNDDIGLVIWIKSKTAMILWIHDGSLLHPVRDIEGRIYSGQVEVVSESR